MPPKAKAKRITKPSFEPTDEERKMVEQMTAVGIPQESVCRLVREGIDDKTLRKHFREELDTAAIKANAQVSGALYNKCLKGDTTSMIWWEKTRQGRKETNVQEHTGKGGGPIETMDCSKLSDSALAELMAARNEPPKK